MEEQKIIAKGQSAARMKKFHLIRVSFISEISDANVKAIAKALDIMKEKHEYVNHCISDNAQREEGANNLLISYRAISKIDA